ncbi:hypothetical protein R5H30_21385 [Sulfitobacter sp. D35]|uniref:hypothetical protein n=1 Tax=Sulfitobacter sp. D35 TaxID=3083252 RepID=UPI00296F82FA|nr:hypothetical protein [Sulfitobacter sp. D35]MDW4500555.1 hypothetical protein [Sulfitobacter sp. D35]
MRILIAAYLLSLLIGLIGTFGWLGQERDPLSWVYVVMLGQPWVNWTYGLPDTLQPWISAATPLLNLLLLFALCRWARSEARQDR